MGRQKQYQTRIPKPEQESAFPLCRQPTLDYRKPALDSRQEMPRVPTKPKFRGLSYELMANSTPIQFQSQVELEEDEPVQGKFAPDKASIELKGESKPKENQTGLPDNLKAGIENLSGMEMDGVKVHYNSPKPEQLKALAYTQGTDIHVAPGQEQHLPHEVWHVVQQMQGRVQPTIQTKGVRINDDSGLEQEADVMGGKAFQMGSTTQTELETKDNSQSVVQQKVPVIQLLSEEVKDWLKEKGMKPHEIANIEKDSVSDGKVNKLVTQYLSGIQTPIEDDDTLEKARNLIPKPQKKKKGKEKESSTTVEVETPKEKESKKGSKKEEKPKSEASYEPTKEELPKKAKGGLSTEGKRLTYAERLATFADKVLTEMKAKLNLKPSGGDTLQEMLTKGTEVENAVLNNIGSYIKWINWTYEEAQPLIQRIEEAKSTLVVGEGLNPTNQKISDKLNKIDSIYSYAADIESAIADQFTAQPKLTPLITHDGYDLARAIRSIENNTRKVRCEYFNGSRHLATGRRYNEYQVGVGAGNSAGERRIFVEQGTTNPIYYTNGATHDSSKPIQVFLNRISQGLLYRDNRGVIT